MTLEEIKDTIKGSPYSMVDFSKHVAVYMGVDWSNKFKDAVAMQLAFRISATFVRRRSDRVILSQSYDNMINLAIELDAAQELTTYPQNDSGYNQARGAGNVNAYDGRSPDGSRFWS